MNQQKDILDLKDLMPDREFVQTRPQILQEIIGLKAKRRVNLGPCMTFLFENKRLIWWQIQEMVRVEQGGQVQAQEELRVYNPMIPSRLRFNTTMMIEISDPVERHTVLAQLSGLEGYLYLSFGEHRIPAYTVCVEGDKLPTPPTVGVSTSSVHFLSFVMNDDQRNAFDAHLPSLVCKHPLYAHTQTLGHDLWVQMKEEK
jgi:hypothetical protein